MRNRRTLRRWVIAAAVALTVGSSTIPAFADPVSDAATALHTAPSYVEPGATVKGHAVKLDEAALRSAFGRKVKVAVFADGMSTSEIRDTGQALGPQLGSVVLAIFSGNHFYAGSSVVCGSEALLEQAVSQHSSQMSAGNYTDALTSFARQAVQAPLQRNGSCGATGGNAAGGNASTSQGSTSQGSTSSGGTVWPWLVGLFALIAAGLGALSLRKRRRQARELSDAKARVLPYYDRLANEVNSLSPGTDPAARQAVADASERYNSAGSQMASAGTVAQWSAIRRTVIEGLQAAQTARKLLNLPEGPEVPPVDEPRGEQLTEQQQVSIQGKQFTGYPSYTPGAPYYYGGGGGYLGGWYTYPFWETMMIGSMMGGGGFGWGGGFGGGGYGAGYDQGYQAAEHNNDNNGSGADTGGGWGGDGGFGGGDGGWGGDGGFGGGDGGWGGGGGFGDSGGGGGSDGGSF